MKQITLTIPKILELNAITKKLIENKVLSTEQKADLVLLLSQIIKEDDFLLEPIQFDTPIALKIWDTAKLKTYLKPWVNLLQNLPDFNGATFCLVGYENEPELLKIQTLVVAFFSPTLSHAMYLSDHAIENKSFEFHLKDDGTAWFKLPTLEDAEKYSDLYNFKGSWKQAYNLLIETLKKGWPMDEFPEELRQFLKKE